MAFTRPVVGADISAADFGQPVYDWIVANTPTAWTNVTPINGYSQFASAPAQYRKLGDNVQLRGRLVVGSATFGVPAFTLPAGFRPPASLVLVCMVTVGGNWITATVDFRSTGDYIPFGASQAGTVADVSLTATTFSTV